MDAKRSADSAAVASEAERVEAAPSGALSRDIVVVGASAGGVQALQRLVSGLPAQYRGSVFIVVHIGPEARSELPAILRRVGHLPAMHASDEMPIRAGHVYVAPPDHHLLIEPGHLTVVHGPRENRHRPAIDPLFRSAAWAYGPRVVGVVLTGSLDDGTAGLWAIKSCGGTTIVQDPDEAAHPDMPLNALMHNRIDHRLPIDQIAPLLVRLAGEPFDPPPRPQPPPTLHDEIEFAKLNRDIRSAAHLGRLSAFTCPACRGALWELEEGGHLRYRCHTGHAYSQDSLLADQTVAMEDGLYTALRAVEEKSAALRRLAARWPEHTSAAGLGYESRAQELDRSAEMLRAMLARSMP